MYIVLHKLLLNWHRIQDWVGREREIKTFSTKIMKQSNSSLIGQTLRGWWVWSNYHVMPNTPITSWGVWVHALRFIVCVTLTFLATDCATWKMDRNLSTLLPQCEYGPIGLVKIRQWGHGILDKPDRYISCELSTGLSVIRGLATETKIGAIFTTLNLTSHKWEK